MPAYSDFLPSRESELVDWARTFDSLITANPTTYGLTAAMATSFNGLFATFDAAYQAAQARGTRTPSAIVAKNDAKAAMIDGPGGIRVLARIVQATPTVTNEQKSDLGLTVRDVEPSPVPVPTFAPGIEIVSAVDRRVLVKLRDTQNPDSRGKPAGVKGATIMSFVGPMPPAPTDIAAWKFETVTSKTTYELEFPPTVASGSTAWVTAFWFNTRLESGPCSPPISAQIPGTLAMAA